MRSVHAFLIAHQIFLNPRLCGNCGINPMMAVRGGAKSEGPSVTHGVLQSLPAISVKNCLDRLLTSELGDVE
jgi:hypothetical protein